MSKGDNPFRYFHSSPDIIRMVVMLYVRYPLSLRNVEDLLFERGYVLCHETVRLWWNRFGLMFAADIRRQRVSRMRGFRHWKWYLEEMYVKLNGEIVYLPDPPRRCMEVGAAVADYFLSTDLRVALIASASWSHAFLSPVNNYLWSDIDADRLMLEALRHGDYDFWRKRTTEELERAGQHEMLNWMLLAGAMERLGRLPEVQDYMESYLFSSQKCFVTYPPVPNIVS